MCGASASTCKLKIWVAALPPLRIQGVNTTGLIEVRTATENAEEAQAIALDLVESGLCAFAHIDEVESYFHWQGKLENITESRLTLACREDVFPEVERRIRDLHSYQEPAVYSFVISGGSESYLAWLRDNSGPAPQV